MDKRRKYFLTQKLMGLGLCAIAIPSILLTGDATFAFFAIPIGLVMLFSKEMLLTNDYFFEVDELAEKNKEEL